MNLREVIEAFYERFLRMQISSIPTHVALIQDGNRRFARQQGMDAAAGHRAGARKTERMLDWARELGIKHITVYSFSTENFNRDEEELEELFALFREMFGRVPRDEKVYQYGIRVQMFGDRSMLPDDLLECIEQAEEATAHNDHLFLNVAIAYGGRNEIVNATKSILEKVKTGGITPEDVDIGLVEAHIQSGHQLPPVDLIVRTGNEKRTSNFLPWTANGNESVVYFCAPFWPMFRRIDLLRAIRVYDQRVKLGDYVPNRRFLN